LEFWRIARPLVSSAPDGIIRQRRSTRSGHRCANQVDNDDNNAFHAKLVVMDFDGTISTEVALSKNKEAYNDILTLGLPLSNDGKPLVGIMGTAAAVVPKGATNIAVAKEFLKYSIEPKALGAYLKTGLGRFLPPMKSIADKRPVPYRVRRSRSRHGQTRVRRARFSG